MIDEFFRITKTLNANLGITPLLYGSLGLGKLLNHDFNPHDIDFLVPQKYVQHEWICFMSLIEKLGYSLVDLHEHKFSNGKHNIAFGGIERLKKDIDITPDQIETIEESGCVYKLLNLQQYLKAYEFSSKDGYRRNKNNNKDFIKIERIKLVLQSRAQLEKL